MSYYEDLKSQVIKLDDVFVAEGARVIGNIVLKKGSSVWYNAVIRGDEDLIEIGEGSNIQDNAIIHTDPGIKVIIGNNVTVGHGAIIHGASIDSNSLIGMGATLLNHVKVGKFCLIGANALLTEGMEVPDYSLVLGMPAKIIKQLSVEEANKFQRNAIVYQQKALKYLKNNVS
jgi:carbonic anhydrase/acetyltransferase-like protein (isoleucine patch superfamily)